MSKNPNIPSNPYKDPLGKGGIFGADSEQWSMALGLLSSLRSDASTGETPVVPNALVTDGSPLSHNEPGDDPSATISVERLNAPESIDPLVAGDVEAMLGYAAAIGQTRQAKSTRGMLYTATDLVGMIVDYANTVNSPQVSETVSHTINAAETIQKGTRAARIFERIRRGSVTESTEPKAPDETLPPERNVTSSHGLRTELVAMHEAGTLPPVDLEQLPTFNPESGSWDLTPGQFRGFIIGLGAEGAIEGFTRHQIVSRLNRIIAGVNDTLVSLQHLGRSMQISEVEHMLTVRLQNRFPASLRDAAHNALLAQLRAGGSSISLSLPDTLAARREAASKDRLEEFVVQAALGGKLGDNLVSVAELTIRQRLELQGHLEHWMRHITDPAIRGKMEGRWADDVNRAKVARANGNTAVAEELEKQAQEALNEALQINPEQAKAYERYYRLIKEIEAANTADLQINYS